MEICCDNCKGENSPDVFMYSDFKLFLKYQLRSPPVILCQDCRLNANSKVGIIKNEV